MKKVPFLLLVTAVCLGSSPNSVPGDPAPAAPAANQPAKIQFDVNDVSFLWPVPKNVADVKKLISITEKMSDGEGLWPKADFDKVLATARTVSVQDGAGRDNLIEFGFNNEAKFFQAENWKIAAFRVDPCAPSQQPKAREVFGTIPQIRLIVQPVTVNGNSVEVHDITAHVVFNFVKNPGTLPAIADEAAFGKLVEDLVEIKTFLKSNNVDTTKAPLDIHPGFVKNVPGFADKLKALLKKHLRADKLTAVSFMGLAPRPDPWVFFAMRRQATGLELAKFSQIGGKTAQMLTFQGGPSVMPAPTTKNLTSEKGVNTTPLFRFGVNVKGAAFSDSESPKLQDIPDIIANPGMSHLFNTDCVSCHTESARRKHFGIGKTDFEFARPEGISEVAPARLPLDQWNVRNFGWGHRQKGEPRATIVMRTANEAAESAHFINQNYLNKVAELEAETSVSHPLTLIMKIKQPRAMHKQKLLQFIGANRDRIRTAMKKLGTVHYARFVIFEDYLMIITTYDNDFDAYVQQFVDEIGDVFDGLLVHVEGTPELPVRENPEDFSRFIKKFHKEGTFFSAYPNLKTLDILSLERASQQATQGR